MEDRICDLIMANIQGAKDPQYKPSKGFFHRSQKTIKKFVRDVTATTDDNQT